MIIETIQKPDFPLLLQRIDDAPQKLYLKGHLPSPALKCLCVVGARHHSLYGKDICHELIQGLKGYSICIVSGLALGIDTVAHTAALQAGLHTIAIPGSGLDDSVLYPQTNHRLAYSIIESGGGLVSEFEPKLPAAPWNFPRRNRIMAGMSQAVLVIEAEKKSGTLITASLAAEYNRDVLAVPGSVFSKKSEGPHYLLREGATAITNSAELLEALGIQIPDQAMPDYSDCSPQEKEILKNIRDPITREMLAQKITLPISEINILLSLLELKGHLHESSGYLRLTS